MKASTVFLVGAGGVLAFLAYRAITRGFEKAKEDVAQAHSAAVDATAGVLTRFFGPKLSQAAKESTYFVVTFDDNLSRHAVPASSVNAEGIFTFANPPMAPRAYALYVDKEGKKHARPV